MLNREMNKQMNYKKQNNNMIALYGGYAKKIDDVKEFKSKLSSDYILRAAKTEPAFFVI